MYMYIVIISQMPENYQGRPAVTANPGILDIHLQVWAYVWSGFFRKFGIDSFLTIGFDYIMKTASLTLTEAGEGATVLATFNTVGFIIIFVTHACKLRYKKLAPHSVLALVYGILMAAVTLTKTKVCITSCST